MNASDMKFPLSVYGMDKAVFLASKVSITWENVPKKSKH